MTIKHVQHIAASLRVGDGDDGVYAAMPDTRVLDEHSIAVDAVMSIDEAFEFDPETSYDCSIPPDWLFGCGSVAYSGITGQAYVIGNNGMNVFYYRLTKAVMTPKYKVGQRVVLRPTAGQPDMPGEHVTITGVIDHSPDESMYLYFDGDECDFEEHVIDPDYAIELVKVDHDLGEPGDPLPQRVIDAINQYAERDYWPLTFGEVLDGESNIELIFCKSSADDEVSAREQADWFIKTGGGN